jgi:hypothetical protein
LSFFALTDYALIYRFNLLAMKWGIKSRSGWGDNHRRAEYSFKRFQLGETLNF